MGGQSISDEHSRRVEQLVERDPLVGILATPKLALPIAGHVVEKFLNAPGNARRSMIVEVEVAGQARTWTREPRESAECIECGSRRFRRSKLTKFWYCKECNEQYPLGKPLFPLITCSAHGKQLMHDEHGNWCWECDKEDWTAPWTNATEHAPRALPPPTPATHRISTSIKIDDDLWRAVKDHCTSANLPIVDYLEQLIREELRK